MAQTKRVLMSKSEKILLLSFLFMLISCATMSYIVHEKTQQIDSLKRENSELQSKLNILNVEVEMVKNDLQEAHEMAGLLFLESMAVTDSYNELKKTKCKGKK